MGLLWWLRWWSICLQCGRPGFNPWVGEIPWRRAWQPTSALLPGESPWTGESGGLQSMGSKRVGHDWTTKHTCYSHLHFQRINLDQIFYALTYFSSCDFSVLSDLLPSLIPSFQTVLQKVGVHVSKNSTGRISKNMFFHKSNWQNYQKNLFRILEINQSIVATQWVLCKKNS